MTLDNTVTYHIVIILITKRTLPSLNHLSSEAGYIAANQAISIEQAQTRKECREHSTDIFDINYEFM